MIAYAHAIARRIAPAHAEDIAQEALLRAWKHRDSFNARRGSRRDWLAAIVRNVARTMLKRESRYVQLTGQPVARPTPQLMPLLQRMGGYGELLALVYVDGLSIKEAAERMGRPYSTTKRDVPRALEQLRFWSEACN